MPVVREGLLVFLLRRAGERTRWIRGVVFVLLAVLVISSTEAVSAPLQAAAAPAPIDPRDVAVLGSPGAAAEPPQPLSTADFGTQARLDGGAGSHFDPQRSKPVSRSMFVTEYENPDGTRSVRQSNQPLNVQDAAGNWQPVQTTLSTDPATKRADADQHPLSPSLATKADDSAVLQVEAGGHTAGLAMDKAAGSTAAVKGDSVTYPEVAAGTDLEYEVTPDPAGAPCCSVGIEPGGPGLRNPAFGYVEGRGWAVGASAGAASGVDHGVRVLAVVVGGADPVSAGRGPVRRLVAALGAVPRVLVWDGEGAIGRWRGGCSELTTECQAFRGTLGTKVVICRPADPEAKGLIERAHDYLERSFLPGRAFGGPAQFNTELAGWLATVNTRPRRALGCAPDRADHRGQGGDACAAGRAGGRLAVQHPVGAGSLRSPPQPSGSPGWPRPTTPVACNKNW